MNCHANVHIRICIMICLYMIVDAVGAQVSLCVVNKKLCYEEYDEMHRELINLHPGVSAPAQS